jgi:LPXTG-site transpeptidase (sortase) family protein
MLTVAGSQNEGDLLSFLPPVGPPEHRLIIPKLNLNVPVTIPSYEALLREDWSQVETDIQKALEGGVVHYPGTAKPGQAGNFFITGHSSYYPWAPGNYKTVFARLGDLTVGDEYWVYYGGDKHRYVVTSVTEVKPSNVDVLDQPVDRRMSTLMTCVPVGTTLRRLIVAAEEVDPETGEVMAIGAQPVRELKRVGVEMLPI